MQNKQSLLLRNQIPKNWQKMKLGDLIKSGVILEVQDGNHGEKHPKQSEYVKNGDRIPFIMANDLSSGNIDFKNCSYIKRGQADRLRIGFSKTDDVLLTHKGNLGLVSIVPKTSFDYIMLTPQVTYYRVDKKRLDNHFLKYVFLNPSFQKELQNISPQSTRPYVGIIAQRDLEIDFIEDIQEQKKIAAILSTFDDKIEVNNKIAKTLEEMAQTLFKEWLVKPQYPVGKLSDIGRIIMGQSPSSKFYNSEGNGLPFHQGVTNFGSRFPKHEVYCTENNRMAEKGDILFSVRAPVGRLNIADTKISLGRGVAAIRHKNNHQSYLYYLLKRLFKKEDSLGGGSVFPSVTKDDMEGMKILVPNEDTVEKFENIVSNIDKKIELIEKENQKLAALRDLLLPKLMKGEIRV